MSETSILAVCLGNICRSPLAEGILRHIVKERRLDWIRIDSCGTAGYHVGEPPHRGSLAIAAERGVSMKGQTSRQVCDADFDRFDWFLAMDTDNRNTLRHIAPSDFDSARIVLLLDYCRGDAPRDVPDPYYVGGFDVVFDMIQDACEGFIDQLSDKR